LSSRSTVSSTDSVTTTTWLEPVRVHAGGHHPGVLADLLDEDDLGRVDEYRLSLIVLVGQTAKTHRPPSLLVVRTAGSAFDMAP
jgi:hypothetical protein